MHGSMRHTSLHLNTPLPRRGNPLRHNSPDLRRSVLLPVLLPVLLYVFCRCGNTISPPGLWFADRVVVFFDFQEDHFAKKRVAAQTRYWSNVAAFLAKYSWLSHLRCLGSAGSAPLSRPRGLCHRKQQAASSKQQAASSKQQSRRARFAASVAPRLVSAQARARESERALNPISYTLQDAACVSASARSLAPLAHFLALPRSVSLPRSLAPPRSPAPPLSLAPPLPRSPALSPRSLTQSLLPPRSLCQPSRSGVDGVELACSGRRV